MTSPTVAEYAAQYPFELDRFQIEALEALARQESVLVAAPTGSGKTVVGEFAVWLALREGGKVFYTTPLKALSNQKFGDFVALHGAQNAGLLTGDNSINPQASVIVMTTEVLRNMIYERSDLLEDLHYVVLDEVHYLQDPYRGAVWEEVIIHLPVDVRIVSLSATVSNAEEFADWIQTLRGPTSAIIEERRPVKLEQHYLMGEKMHPMFLESDGEQAPNPAILRLESQRRRQQAVRRRKGDVRRGRGGGSRLPRRPDVAEFLEEEKMLPAIYFIFSRKGCDMAVSACLRQGIRLTNAAERRRIREFAEMRCSYLSDEDLAVLGYGEWLEALSAGIAAHHAGRIPVFKETVEELFQAGLVKVVFATETLSLGINMPAKSVVIESLMKFTGERHELMTPGEFTQLTGRAGRRGIDSLGHAIVLEQRDLDFRQIAGLASTRTYQLVSSFQPSYNMATNLVRNYSREEAEHLLNSSFAQYRVDKDVVVLEKLIERNEAYLASYKEKMSCDLGDFAAYWRIHERLHAAEREAAESSRLAMKEATRAGLGELRPGDVLWVESGRHRGPVVVLGARKSRRGDPQVTVLTAARRVVRLGPEHFPTPPRPAGDLSGLVPPSGAGAVGPEVRRKLGDALNALDLPDSPGGPEAGGAGEAALLELQSQLMSHPCHRCPDRDRHAKWAGEAERMRKEIAGLRKRAEAHTSTLSKTFARVLRILQDYGYVDGFELTAKGRLLAGIYNESDLLVAECLHRGVFDEFTPEELAALVSTFVFESRGPVKVHGYLPTGRTRQAYARIVRLAGEIRDRESSQGVGLTRAPETGFAETAYRWCAGDGLDEVLGEEMPPGDFIRSTKQTIDLVRQLQAAAGKADLAARLEAAAEGLDRGVIAYTGTI